LRLFRWLSAKAIPPSIDLRRCGWRLVGRETARDVIRRSPALAHADNLDNARWRSAGGLQSQSLRGLVLLLGVDDDDARARLLRLGFGDVLGSRTSLPEIEARAARIAAHAVAQASVLPRSRNFGGLRLDLFARDGFVGPRRLGLHPREFALIWRLADTPGVPVGKTELVNDVWRMAHVPDTNSIAVHIFRLRAKLAIAGLASLVQTAPSGGYFLAPAISPPGDAPFMLAGADGHESAAMALSAEQNLPWEPQP